MTVEDFIRTIDDPEPGASNAEIEAFEREIGAQLPDDYRRFLATCNGGYVGGAVWNGDVGVLNVLGLREGDFSLRDCRACYQHDDILRIPGALVPIMDDPFGNEICLGIADPHLGRVYFWDHEQHPGDGTVESARNLTRIADTFTEFVAGLAVQR